MRSDLLVQLTAASVAAQSLTGEAYTMAGTAYTLTPQQLTDVEASEGGYEITPHGRKDRQVWLLLATRAQFAHAQPKSWVGKKLRRRADGVLHTVRAVDDTSDPLHLRIIAITSA